MTACKIFASIRVLLICLMLTIGLLGLCLVAAGVLVAVSPTFGVTFAITVPEIVKAIVLLVVVLVFLAALFLGLSIMQRANNCP
jgi:hypothetical protein